MTASVVLSAALRNNLLSLQGTQSAIDKSQLELSSGKKVNSALDNPQEYFQSQSLTNRANDLSSLLDGIGQSIEVIKAANNGITALTSLVNQAQATAQSAQTAVAAGSNVAQVTSAAGTLTGNTVLTGLTGVANGDQLKITVSDPADGTDAIDPTAAGDLTISTGETLQDLVDKINDINDTGNAGAALSTPAISASINSSGQLSISAINGGTLAVNFVSSTTTTAANQGLATALGFGGVAKVDNSGGLAAATDKAVNVTAVASSALNTVGLYSSTGTIAEASTKLTSLVSSTGTALTSLTNGTTLTLTVDGKTSSDLLSATPAGGTAATATTQTIQGTIDAINNDTKINTLVSASYDDTTGQISIAALSSSATDVQFQLTNGTASESKLDLFQGAASAIDTGAATANEQGTTDLQFGAAAGQLASLQTQYNSTLSQIDQLVQNGDTGYQGVNLLNGDNLQTTFNETRTSSLTTQGTDFSSKGLGLTSANFSTSTDVNNSVDQLNAALSTVRNYGSGLANDLATIQTRQTFVNSTISTLQEGSDNLVNADTNAAGATLLALQTQQSLGVTALSLASQSAQSVLKLFS
jgi:flagellin